MTNFHLTKINASTQRGQHIIDLYRNAWRTTLRDAYPSGCSCKKEKSFADIKEFMDSIGGEKLRITGKNTSQYSCAFRYVDSSTGEKRIAYFTSGGSYYVPFEFSTITADEFAKRWNENVSDNIKKHTANALQGRVVTNMEDAEAILNAAEGFSLMEKLFAGKEEGTK